MNPTLLMPELKKISFKIKGKTEYIYTDIDKKLLPLKMNGNTIEDIAVQIKSINPESIVVTEKQQKSVTDKINKL